jgi:hypothetical protein
MKRLGEKRNRRPGKEKEGETPPEENGTNQEEETHLYGLIYHKSPSPRHHRS